MKLSVKPGRATFKFVDPEVPEDVHNVWPCSTLCRTSGWDLLIQLPGNWISLNNPRSRVLRVHASDGHHRLPSTWRLSAMQFLTLFSHKKSLESIDSLPLIKHIKMKIWLSLWRQVRARTTVHWSSARAILCIRSMSSIANLCAAVPNTKYQICTASHACRGPSAKGHTGCRPESDTLYLKECTNKGHQAEEAISGGQCPSEHLAELPPEPAAQALHQIFKELPTPTLWASYVCTLL